MALPEKEQESKTDEQPKRSRIMKRLMDISLGVLLVIVLSPLFLYICILIYKKEGRPIFHRENCIEEKNGAFTMWKFRTLSQPSRLITALPPYPNRHVKPPGDRQWDRYRTVTATGRWLKKYKLDRLPLLLHVIKGDMSFTDLKAEPDEQSTYEYQQQPLAATSTGKNR